MVLLFTYMDPKLAAQEFLASHQVGTLATISMDGVPRARTLYYAPGDDLSLYFLTLTASEKVGELSQNPAVSFLISDESLPGMLEVQGTVEDLSETATDDEHTKALLATLMQHGERFAPITRMDASAIRIYKLTPHHARFGDFSLGQGTDAVLHDISFS